MQNLQAVLTDYSLEMLTIIANRWDVDLESRIVQEVAEQLTLAMLDPKRVAGEWERLTDKERGALQMVLGTNDYKMPSAQYERLFGDIRQMGPEALTRDKPYLDTKGVAETLYFRGLLHLGIDQSRTGMQEFVFVPPDLATIMPIHQTGFDLSAQADDFDEVTSLDLDLVEDSLLEHTVFDQDPDVIFRADTSIIDDLTTFLAYIQMHEVVVQDRHVDQAIQDDVKSYFIGEKSAARFTLIFHMSLELDLIENVEGKLQPIRTTVRRWLEGIRTKQSRNLVEAWFSTHRYNELKQVPNLKVEEGSWKHDPTYLRQILHDTIKLLPTDKWVVIDDLIMEIKETDPDFQRPGGDYDSWYIRDAQTQNYLNGFESWDAVEGATLYYTIVKTLHWLSLVDLAAIEADSKPENAEFFRLTAFGRAWVGNIGWPELQDPDVQVDVEADGTIHIPRGASRYDRFQLARFSSWVGVGDTFTYRLTSDGLKHASQQGIQPTHIQAFLQRTTGQELPPQVQKMLDSWGGINGTSAILTQMLVLQVDAPELMQTIWETPEIRRFLGRRLGPLAVTVRAEQWEELITTLEQHGIPVDTNI
jgi:hypothetical protein